MKIVGIIAEYNPFHQGHSYHLSQAKSLTDADYTIVVMSGNYVQRGVPAMFDKYTRAEAALRSGADLVLELPLCAATGSAEYFASGAIALLHAAGIVTDLCFGSECGDMQALSHTADILSNEPEDYQTLLREHLKNGDPFPKARAQACREYDPSVPVSVLEEPNNLLALEYLKALKKQNCQIIPHTVLRSGSHYHENVFSGDTKASASGIRTALLDSCGHITADVKKQLPHYNLYQAYDGKTPITEDAFSLLLLEKLRRLQDEPLTDYFDVSEELSNRIWNNLDDYQSFSQFTNLLKTRNLTRTAVSRALLHILLDIHKYEEPHMFRVLGFRKKASSLLGNLAAQNTLPVITGLASSGLSSGQLYADRLYESVRSLYHGQIYQNEYRRKMLVI